MTMFSMALPFVTLAVAALGVVNANPVSSSNKPCTYPNPCWPSQADWGGLNSTLHGSLFRARPPAAPCHAPFLNEGICQQVQKNWTSEFWRSQQLGAYQNLAAENGDSYCNIDNNATVPCAQGLVPIYMARVKNLEDVKTAVCFAKEHNLSTRVKGAAHDYWDRSSGNGTFGIQTIDLKGINFEQSWKPDGAGGDAPSSSVVHVAAGEQWYYVNKAASQNHVQVIGGASYSVGAAGGWILGGGHSSLSPTYGLGVDNVLQFEMVTPDGVYRVVNKYKDSDLFWALRGGGGGFGVVTKVTYKTYPAQKALTATTIGMNYTNASYPGLLKTLLPLQPLIAQRNLSGYLFPTPTSLAGVLYILNSANTTIANSTIQPLYEFVASEAQNGRNVTMEVIPTTYTDYFQLFPGNPENVTESGVAEAIVLGSRLMPVDLFKNTSAVDQLIGLMANTTLIPQLLLVGGGKVNQVGEDEMALHPSWRRARVHFIVATGYLTNTTFATRDLLRQGVTNTTQLLGSLVPGFGSYLNEADPNEPNWTETFWGSHYPRLLSIKNMVDPNGLFTCRRCVGDAP